MNIYFLQPFYLFLLFLIPLLILIHFISIKMSRRQAIGFANFDALARIKGIDLYSKNITILILGCLIILFIALSVSGTTLQVNKNVSNFSFVIAVDSSKSMEANDYYPDRLTAAKQSAIDFVNNIPFGTNLGVISFAGSSIIEQTLTNNKDDIKNAINGITLTSIGGTDVYGAIITSINLLINEKNKAMILISDGQVNSISIDYAIEYAKRNNLVVNSIAIGTATGGNTSYGLSKLDEDSLKAISFNTGGSYYNISNIDELKNAFNSTLGDRIAPVSIDLSRYLLFIALTLFILLFVLVNTRFRMFP